MNILTFVSKIFCKTQSRRRQSHKTEILYRGRGLIGFPTQDHLVTEPTVRNIMGHSTALKFGKNWLG